MVVVLTPTPVVLIHVAWEDRSAVVHASEHGRWGRILPTL